MGAKYDREADEGKVHKARLPGHTGHPSVRASIGHSCDQIGSAFFLHGRSSSPCRSCDVPEMIDNGAIIVDP